MPRNPGRPHSATDASSLSVAAVCHAFGLSPGAVRPISGGFSGDRIFEVQSGDRQVAVRCIQSRPAMPLHRLEEIHQLQTAVHKAGLDQVPRLFERQAALSPRPSLSALPNADSSAPCAESPTILRDGSCYWQIESWQPGRPTPLPTSRQISAAMSALAHLHQQTAVFGRSRLNKDGPSPALAARQHYLSSLTPQKLTSWGHACRREDCTQLAEAVPVVIAALISHRDRLLREATQLMGCHFPLIPILRDVWYGNLLFEGSCLTGIIDWMACGTDHPAVDLSRLLGSWCPGEAAAWDEAIRCYETARRIHLTPAEHRLLTFLDEAGCLLRPATWLRRRYEAGRTEELSDPTVLARFLQLTAAIYPTLDHRSR